MWLAIALVGYVVLAAVTVLDKFILDKSVKRPAVFVFYSSIFILPIFLLLPLGVKFLSTFEHYLIAAVAGATFALALYFMYRAYQAGEVSHAGPLTGALVAAFTVPLSQYFLNEQLSARQLWAVAFLVLGSLVIAWQKRGRARGWQIGVLYGLLSGLLFAISHVSSKYVYDLYGFYSGLIWTRGFLGVAGLTLLFLPSVRLALRRQNGARGVRRLKSQVALVAANKILGVVGVILTQLAIALGSVAAVNALQGVQYGLLIILVFWLSRFAPRYFKETYLRGELFQEAAAVVLIGAGLAMMI